MPDPAFAAPLPLSVPPGARPVPSHPCSIPHMTVSTRARTNQPSSQPSPGDAFRTSDVQSPSPSPISSCSTDMSSSTSPSSPLATHSPVDRTTSTTTRQRTPRWPLRHIRQPFGGQDASRRLREQPPLGHRLVASKTASSGPSPSPSSAPPQAVRVLNAAAIHRAPFPTDEERTRGQISDLYFSPAGGVGTAALPSASPFPARQPAHPTSAHESQQPHSRIQSHPHVRDHDRHVPGKRKSQPQSPPGGSGLPHSAAMLPKNSLPLSSHLEPQSQSPEARKEKKQSKSEPQSQSQSQTQTQQQLGSGSLFNVQGAGPWLYRPPPPYCTLPQPHVGDHISVLDGRIGYLGPVNRNKIVRALEMAASHNMPMLLAQNLTIAAIVADMQMDVDTVCAAVLRGMLPDQEDTVLNLGRDVATILSLHRDIVAVVNAAKQASNRALCAETDFANLRELILVSALDHRAISLELASAVVATRALDSLPANHDKALAARLALHLYAPLANQLGIYFIQSELEELAFMHLHPDQFHSIRMELASRTRESQTILAENKAALDRALSTTPAVRAHVRSIAVKGRIKGTYSCYRKLSRTGKGSLSDIYDLLALRVIVQAKGPDEAAQAAACYSVADAVRASFNTIPSREKDYVANPKPNGYRSLHLTVTPPGPDGEGSADGVSVPTRPPLEIQIRTEMMHHVAEFGAAAHWVYKEKSSPTSPLAIGEQRSVFPSSDPAMSRTTGAVAAASFGASQRAATGDSTLGTGLPTAGSLGDTSAASFPDTAPVHSVASPLIGDGDEEEDDIDGSGNGGVGSWSTVDVSPSSQNQPPSSTGEMPSSRRSLRSVSPAASSPVMSVPVCSPGRREVNIDVAEQAHALMQEVGDTLSYRPYPSSAGGYAVWNMRRSGYIKSLAKAISASRVIVRVYGRLYRMCVGATLRDLAIELGVVSLSMCAVVNGTPVPLTHRLKMSDTIVWL